MEKRKLYYLYVELPKQVHIISRKLGIDMNYDPWIVDEEKNPISIDELFDLAEGQDFDEVKVFLTEDHFAYYRDDRNNQIYVTGWIDLKNYIDGGSNLNDPIYVNNPTQ